MGFCGYVLRPELIQVSFIELMEIHAMCGSHPCSLQRILRSISAAANGIPPQGPGFSSHCLPGTSLECVLNRCLFHKTLVPGISL
jgi:hypothetical protein